LSDPILALQLLRDEELEEYGDLRSVALVAVDMLASVRDASKEHIVNITDDDMRVYVTCADHDMSKQNQYTVTLLQRAGYSRLR